MCDEEKKEMLTAKRNKTASNALPKIDTKKLLKKVPVAQTKNGAILLDRNSPIHRKWMED